MTPWWGVAGGLGGTALAAAMAERRRRRRADPDRVGMVDWTGVQLVAVAGAIVAISVALHA